MINPVAADSIQNLPKLVEDIVQTSINTGPRGPLRLAQGIQAVIGVGTQWVADASKVIYYASHLSIHSLHISVGNLMLVESQLVKTLLNLNFLISMLYALLF